MKPSSVSEGLAALSDEERVPLSDIDMQIALGIRRVVKEYGSLGAFYEHLEKERKRKNRLLCEQQARELNAATMSPVPEANQRSTTPDSASPETPSTQTQVHRGD